MGYPYVIDMAKWRSISINEDLFKMIAVIKDDTGHNSVSDFIQDAVRRRIEGLLVLYPDLKEKIKAEDS